ncbi:hypothetical protein FGO68_gene9463 [Halteria grandinella]|uniref:Uncharacterized protein n=1 Tax=Halteria grandinella TaxID=5974 RepID=A0A8J8T3P6_HALGN|nr:hypothetical protein FGO68_gene9463 [Halteria grandinella]
MKKDILQSNSIIEVQVEELRIGCFNSEIPKDQLRKMETIEVEGGDGFMNGVNYNGIFIHGERVQLSDQNLFLTFEPSFNASRIYFPSLALKDQFQNSLLAIVMKYFDKGVYVQNEQNGATKIYFSSINCEIFRELFIKFDFGSFTMSISLKDMAEEYYCSYLDLELIYTPTYANRTALILHGRALASYQMEVNMDFTNNIVAISGDNIKYSNNWLLISIACLVSAFVLVVAAWRWHTRKNWRKWAQRIRQQIADESQNATSSQSIDKTDTHSSKDGDHSLLHGLQ